MVKYATTATQHSTRIHVPKGTNASIRYASGSFVSQGRVSSAAKVEDAVYTYIRAVRALGKEQINTADIAKALDLPLRAVESAVRGLNSKGVKKLA